MPEFDLSPAAQQWINLVLIWLGFGILAGLLARALVPGREPAGPLATLVVGVAGSTIGLFVLSRLVDGRPINPISLPGLLAATGGALVLLIAYRVVGVIRIEPPEQAESEEKAKTSQEGDSKAA